MTVLMSAAADQIAAQVEEQAKYIKLRDEKKALKVFQRADWIFDYAEALRRARLEGKVVFTYFTRSYAG